MKKIKTCEICKYWKENQDRSHGRIGECNNPHFHDMNEVGYAYADPAGLYTWDYEGYQSGWETGPDFGCIHWESSEPDDLKRRCERDRLEREIRERLEKLEKFEDMRTTKA